MLDPSACGAFSFRMDRPMPDDELDELRWVVRWLVASEDSERRRTAMALHDDIGQRLAFLEMELDRTRQMASGEVQDTLNSLRTQMSELSEVTRTLARRLYPSALEHLGLAVALESLAAELEAEGDISIHFRHSAVPDPLEADVASAIYDIARQVLRYLAGMDGEQTHVRMLLEGIRGEVRLSIQTAAEPIRGIGEPRKLLPWPLLRARARLAGGQLTVENHPERLISVTVPLPM